MDYENMTKEQLIHELYRRDNLIKFLQESIHEIVWLSEDFRKLAETKEAVITEMMKRIKVSDVAVYKKEDIMNVFDCESDKALRILKIAQQMNYASKIGKEFVIKKENLQKFLEFIEGKDLKI